MELVRSSPEAVRQWDEKQLAKEHEYLLSKMPSLTPGGEQQHTCLVNLRIIGQELLRRLELARATAS